MSTLCNAEWYGKTRVFAELSAINRRVHLEQFKKTCSRGDERFAFIRGTFRPNSRLHSNANRCSAEKNDRRRCHAHSNRVIWPVHLHYLRRWDAAGAPPGGHVCGCFVPLYLRPTALHCSQAQAGLTRVRIVRHAGVPPALQLKNTTRCVAGRPISGYDG